MEKALVLDDAKLARMSKRIEGFISDYVLKNSAKGLVVGLSGGLDSSVVLKLAVNALSPSSVLGLVMPSDTTPEEDTTHAVGQAKSLGIEYFIIDIRPLIANYMELLPADKKARGNLMARVRMSILYYHANVRNYIVAGTSDKSELQIGYFSKFGDGAADVLPIAGLYKTQTRALAKYLNIPQAIVEKKSSPRLWDNQLAEEEIGMDYETIDQILCLMLDRKLKPNAVAKKLGIPVKQINTVREMIKSSQHKRDPIPLPS